EMIGVLAQAIDLDLQIFALPTNITLAIGPSYAQKVVMLRLPPGSLDLRRLAVLTEIYNGAGNGTLAIADAIAQLTHLDELYPPFRPWLSILSYCVLSLGVAIVLGAGAHELIVAALIGISTGSIAAIATRNATVERLFEVLAALAGTLILAAFNKFVGPANIYISIIAGVVQLLPGYSLTTALQELANHDLVAGVARLGKVLSTLLALACGVAFGITIAGSGFFATVTIKPHPIPAIYWLLAVVLMATGLSINLQARSKDVFWVLLSCFLALYTSRVFGELPGHQVATFASALVCGLVANIGARFLKVPRPVLLVPALITLVPGSLSYESFLNIFQHDYNNAATLGVNAVLSAIFIVAGLLLSQLLFPTNLLRSAQSKGVH
ncbi:MAG: threonine/serine exporter family protein, partial [Candidatus Eremiobacteraeota bacterium]|nr:threonine/serine exporter family protein [Candidatus Eremiobacteraeota bacterium]